MPPNPKDALPPRGKRGTRSACQTVDMGLCLRMSTVPTIITPSVMTIMPHVETAAMSDGTGVDVECAFLCIAWRKIRVGPRASTV